MKKFASILVACVACVLVALIAFLAIYKEPVSALHAISRAEIDYVEKMRYATLYDKEMIRLCEEKPADRGGSMGKCLSLSSPKISSPLGRMMLVAASHRSGIAGITDAEQKSIVAVSLEVVKASQENPVWAKYRRLLLSCSETLLPCPILGRPAATDTVESLGRMRRLLEALQAEKDHDDIKSEIERVAREN